MKIPKFSPFSLLLSELSLAVLLGLGLVFGLAGCGTGTNSPAGDNPLTIGFIYVGPKDDYGYNQAHHEGAEAVKKISGVKVLEEENVPETDAVQKTMKSMIEVDNAKLIFPTSFGYFNPHILEVAKDHKDVTFLHCGGLYDEKVHPKNVGSYFGFIDECQYLSGIVAGHATKTKKIGFVAAKPIPQVLRNVNAFALGARSVDPSIECIVIFTGDWSNPKEEAKATDSLIDQQVDVITCHVDSPKTVVQNAARRDVMVCGYHCSQEPLVKDKYLTGAEWNWAKVYTDYVNDLKAGKKIENFKRGGLSKGIVKMSPYGPKVSDKAKKQADDVKAEFMADKFVIFKGGLKDNQGKEVIPKGMDQKQEDKALESMNYLVEGVKGKIPGN